MEVNMKHVTVFGSFIVDLMARSNHLPQPGETVKSSMFKISPGGKGFNQGIAAKKSGADMTMVTKIGKDTFADIAINKMNEENMATEFVFKADGVPTGTAIIMVDEKTSQNEIMVTLGACETFNDDDIKKITSLIKKSGFLLIQLETNVDAIGKIIDIAKENGVKVVLNPAPIQPISDELFKKIDIITPNEVEASILTNVQIKTPEDALKAADVFFSKGVKNVVITLGKMGVMAVTKEGHRLFENYDVKVLDTTGAGDAFNGGLITALSEGEDLFDACFFGNVVSNLAVTKIGTSIAMPTREEIDNFISYNKISF
jgi:ribokinase